MMAVVMYLLFEGVAITYSHTHAEVLYNILEIPKFLLLQPENQRSMTEEPMSEYL